MDEEIITKIKESIQQNLQDESMVSLAKDSSPTVEAVEGGGWLNHVARVTSSDGSASCLVKVYLHYVRALGPDVPIEISRCQRENDANHFFRSLVPNCCPLPYFCDNDNNIGCFEDLHDSHRLWGEDLLTSCDLHTGAKLADLLVTLHSSSHKEKIGADKFAELQAKFSPLPQHLNFLCDYHFVKPFLGSHRDNKARDETVRVKVDEIIQDEVVTKATELAKEWMAVESGNCCIHGDLHVKSVMLNKADGDIQLIDTEASRIGPEAFDVALLVCNYVILYHYHQVLGQEEEEQGDCDHAQLMTQTLDLICITMSRYMEGMSRALQDKFDKHQVWRQILLFLGVEIIAWISGPPAIGYVEAHPKAQLNCLNTALRILHKQSLSLDTKGLSRLIHNQH